MKTSGPVSREQLYELVWSKPMLRVAEDFGVSSSYMARVCTELRVPRPAQGYWTRVEFGSTPQRTSLPPARAGDVCSWQPGASVGTTQRIVQRAQRAVASTQAEVPAASNKRGSRVGRVPDAPAVHPMLKNVKPLFLKTRAKDNGLLCPFKRMLVDVLTSEELLGEAIAAANALFLALMANGHQVTFMSPQSQPRRQEVDVREQPGGRQFHKSYWGPDRPTVVHIGEVAIGLTLFEMVEEVETVYANGKYLAVRDLTEQQLRRLSGPHHWKSSELRPTGRFCLQAYCPTTARVKWVQHWKEKKSGELRDQIRQIVSALESAVPELTVQLERARLEAEEERRRREEQWRKWEEERQREREAAAIKAAKDDLYKVIAAWDEAQQLEAFFAAASLAAQRLEPNQREAIFERVMRARQLVRGPEPLDMLLHWKTPQERL